jgi:hypothetical protein
LKEPFGTSQSAKDILQIGLGQRRCSVLRSEPAEEAYEPVEMDQWPSGLFDPATGFTCCCRRLDCQLKLVLANIKVCDFNVHPALAYSRATRRASVDYGRNEKGFFAIFS